MSAETKMMGNATTVFFLPPAGWLTRHNTGNSCRKGGKITREASFVFFFKRDSWNSTNVKRPLKHESTGDGCPRLPPPFPPRASFLASAERKHLRGSPLTQLQFATADAGDGPQARGPCGERKCNHTRSRWDWEIHIWIPERVWRTETLLVLIT